MSLPAKYPPAVNPANWNAMVDRVNGYTPSGTFISPYSFLITIIDVGGTDYYYANNAFQTVYGGPSNAGSIDGTDFDAVLDKVISDVQAVDGGQIYFAVGTYIAAAVHTLTESHNISFFGAGGSSNFAQPNTLRENRKFATLIKASGALDQILYFVKCVNCKVRMIAFSGEDTADMALHLSVAHMLEVSDCYFMGFLSNCVKFSTNSDGAGDYTGDNWVLRNTFSLADNDVDWCVGLGFQGDANTGDGGSLRSPTEDTFVQGNYFYSYTHKGIGIKLYEPVDRDNTKAYIDSLRIDNNAMKLLHYGIEIDGDDGSYCTNNNFELNTVDIVINATNCQVKTRFTGNRNTVVTTALVMTRTGSYDYTNWAYNSGYVTENSGFGYDAAASTKTVSHGLDASAADVTNIHVLAQTANGQPLKISNITATTFDVSTLETVTEKLGYATNKGDADTVSHGLGVAPTNVIITPTTVTVGTKVVHVHWAGATADENTFTVAINDSTDTPIASGVDFAWRASVQTTPNLYTFYWYARIWCYT